MAKHFTKRHVVNGYAAMGGNKRRPIYAGTNSNKGDIKAAIEAEKRKAQRMANASKSKK